VADVNVSLYPVFAGPGPPSRIWAWRLCPCRRSKQNAFTRSLTEELESQPQPFYCGAGTAIVVSFS